MAEQPARYHVLVVASQPLACRGVQFLLSEMSRPLALTFSRSVTDIAARLGPSTRQCRKVVGGARVTVAIMVEEASPADRQWLCTRWPTVVMMPKVALAPVLAAIRQGARSVVSTDTDRAELRVALETAVTGGFYLGRGLSQLLVGGLIRPSRRGAQPVTPRSVLPLAPREAQTLRLIAGGRTHAEAARELGLTEATVNTYVKRIRSKLGAGNKAELTRCAIEFGYLKLQPAGGEASAG